MPRRSLFRAFLLLFPLLLPLGAGLASATQDEPMHLASTARGKTMEQAVEGLQRAIVNHNYSFVRQQSLDSRLVPQGQEAYGRDASAVRLVYFCNFAKMDRALALDPRAAQMLPCRVTLVQTPEGVELLAVNPAWLSHRMGNPALHRECQELKQDYLAILEEAAL